MRVGDGRSKRATLPTDSMLRIVKMVKKAGLKAKPKLGIQVSSGVATATKELGAEGTKDVGWLIAQGERVLDAGADIITIDERRDHGERE